MRRTFSITVVTLAILVVVASVVPTAQASPLYGPPNSCYVDNYALFLKNVNSEDYAQGDSAQKCNQDIITQGLYMILYQYHPYANPPGWYKECTSDVSKGGPGDTIYADCAKQCKNSDRREWMIEGHGWYEQPTTTYWFSTDSYRTGYLYCNAG